MKKNQVPQDQGSLSSKNINEVCYALDEQGNYVQVLSSGWEVKTLALNESLDLIAERIEKAKNKVLAAESSPIPYFMELNRMDLPLLANYMGIHKWFVKRHFNPKRFNKLKQNTLAKYAEIFNISVEELKTPFGR